MEGLRYPTAPGTNKVEVEQMEQFGTEFGENLSQGQITHSLDSSGRGLSPTSQRMPASGAMGSCLRRNDGWGAPRIEYGAGSTG